MAQEEQQVTRVGEVVESATHAFVAQAYRLHQAPPLGTLVRTAAPEVYGVVASVTTESLDPGRRVLARGEEEESEEDIYRSHPQLSQLLCTRFQALIVGHSDGQRPLHYLPPLPPRVHAFVYGCTPQEVQSFTRSMDFLHLLAGATVTSRDEVIAACLRRAASTHDDPRPFLVHAGKALALELAGEMTRLNAILRRLTP